jgi:hypothetical protein
MCPSFLVANQVSIEFFEFVNWVETKTFVTTK